MGRSGDFIRETGLSPHGARQEADNAVRSNERRTSYDAFPRSVDAARETCSQLNRLETDSSDAVREMASPMRSAIVMTRTFGAASTADVGWIESVMMSSLSFELEIRATAPPERTP